MATITDAVESSSSGKSSTGRLCASAATRATACRSPAASSPIRSSLWQRFSHFPGLPLRKSAPCGNLPGVSGFQVQFSSSDVYTPGDAVDVLVAMNPAALKMNIKDLKTNGILIVNSDSFSETICAGPSGDESAGRSFARCYRVFPVQLERLTQTALEELGLDASP